MFLFCLHFLRLLILMVSHRTELQRVVATLVSDYTTAVKSITLLPVVKVCQWPSLLGSLVMYICQYTEHLRSQCLKYQTTAVTEKHL